MSIPRKPKTQAITTEVPEHLVDAFIDTMDAFLAEAHNGTTSAQRAAEVRAQDKDAGLDSLVHLLAFTESDVGQAAVIARFLAGLYNGTDFPFDMTDLRGLDGDLFEHCLAVLRLDNRPTTEVHGYIPNGEARWEKMIAQWGLDDRPAPEPRPVEGEHYQCRYVTCGEAPGYRDVTLIVSIADDPTRRVPIEMRFSAADSVQIAEDLVGIHRRARNRGTPIDAKEGEKRPTWAW